MQSEVARFHTTQMKIEKHLGPKTWIWTVKNPIRGKNTAHESKQTEHANPRHVWLMPVPR